MNNLSIRTRLLVGIMLPALIVYSAFVVVETRQGKAEAVRRADLYLREVTARFAAQSDGQFFAASQIAVGTADVLSLERLLTEKELYELLRQSLTSHPVIGGSCIAFQPGGVRDGLLAAYVCRTPDGKGLLSSDLGVEYVKAGEKPYTEWPWFLRPRAEGKGAWSEPYFDKGGGEFPMCTYSMPFFRDEKFCGVATVDISLESIRREFSKVSPEGVSFWLFSAAGEYIAFPDGADDAILAETAAAYRDRVNLTKIRGANHAFFYDYAESPDVWLAVAPMETTGWSLMASMPESVVMASVYKQLYRSVAVFALVFLIIAGVITLATWRLTAPIRRLAEFAGELAEGNLDAKVGAVANGGNEINRLAAAFDKMTVDLKSNIEQRIHEESARKAVENELTVARRIQSSLLPRIFPPFPERKEFELHALNEPAAFIAGDFFDFFFLDQQTLGIVLADVSGHGVPAAMFMAVSRTAIRNNALIDRSPVEIISRVNKILCTDNDDMMFVTVFYGHYDVTDGTLRYINAGHNPPYVLRSDGTQNTLEPTGPFLATFEDAVFEEQSVRLQPGEVLFTFTDGVTEAHADSVHDLFGEKRLEKLLDEIRGEPVVTICDRVRGTVDAFSRGQRHDDVTLLVLKRNI